MTPIESPYDVRFATLIGIVVDAMGDLAISTNTPLEQLLAESLYRVNKQVQSVGAEGYVNSLNNSLPLLRDVII